RRRRARRHRTHRPGLRRRRGATRPLRVSVAASRWVLDRLADPECELTPTARAVLLVLAVEASHPGGVATTGAARLGAVLDVSRNTIWRAVRELRAWPYLPA